MSMTDPVADLLTRLRNGAKSRLETVEVPASRLKANIVKVLKDEGFVEGFKLRHEGSSASIAITLKYDGKGKPVLHGIRRVSRPGLRRYVDCGALEKMSRPSSVFILSTSQGVLASQSARKQRLGGELLCEVW